MKGFLIGMGILTALAIGLFTQYEVIGEKVLASIEAEEGTPEALKELQARDPKALVAKCQPLMAKRWKLAWAGNLLGSQDFSAKVARSSLNRYMGTELVSDPNLEEQVYLLGMIKNQTLPPVEANEIFKQYLELYPTGKHLALVRNALNHHAVKFGIN